jgi:N-acyl-D-aspartate/D-glutamate deacylase
MASFIIMGNCGVGWRRANSDREALVGDLVNVEGMSLTLQKGVQWSWESMGEYLNPLLQVLSSVNVAR